MQTAFFQARTEPRGRKNTAATEEMELEVYGLFRPGNVDQSLLPLVPVADKLVPRDHAPTQLLGRIGGESSHSLMIEHSSQPAVTPERGVGVLIAVGQQRHRLRFKRAKLQGGSRDHVVHRRGRGEAAPHVGEADRIPPYSGSIELAA